MLLLETAQAQSCSVPREGTMCCHCSCLEKQGLLALLSPQLGQAVWSGQEATSSTAPPAPFPLQQPISLPWLGPLLASHRKDTLRGRVQILGALSFSFFLVDWPLPSACLCPPTPIPFSLCSQNYKQESQCSCRSCPSRKSVEKRLGAVVLRGARLMTEPPGSSSQSMLSKLASARSRAMPPDGS